MEQKTPLIIYHRGRHGRGIRAKENTIEAFEAAIKDGASMIEFDVQSDLRVEHDHSGNPSVPMLWSVMNVIHARCAVNIEIKCPVTINGVLDVIDDALTIGSWTTEKIVVSSFHHKTVIDIKQQFPELRVGVINDGVLPGMYIDWLAKQGINNLHLDWANIYMDIEDDCRMRAAARANNMQIWVWTVNTKEIFDTVVRYGADAVFTDKPQLFR